MRCRLFLLEKLNLGSDIYCREVISYVNYQLDKF
nr:MAG TPA: hypothetical protein [Caudoviricetes sp.]